MCVSVYVIHLQINDIILQELPYIATDLQLIYPDSNFHMAHTWPTWVLSPQVGPM